MPSPVASDRYSRASRKYAAAMSSITSTSKTPAVRNSLRIRWALLLTSASLLAACSPGAGIYDKPGLTYAEWKRDDADVLPM